MKSDYPLSSRSSKPEEAQIMTRRIMVVDDDPALRMTLEEILTDEGHDVISAEDGYQAIRFASENPIALIFMDIRMPGMTGIDAFSRIKEILPDCVVVLMTGHAVQSLVDEAWEQGAREILQKPVIIDRLLEIVDEVVPRSIAS